MKNIILVSSFDPINNQIIDDLQKYNSSDVFYHFCVIHSKYCDINTRIAMINIALKDKNIKYDFIQGKYSDVPSNSIDLIEIFNNLDSKFKENVFLLIHDEKSYLIDEQKIREYKAKLSINGANDYSKCIRMLQKLDTPKSIIDYIVTNNLYFMNVINNYLSGKRLVHSISVANTAYDIAISNNLERPDEYYIAGLLHDIGKQVDKDTSINIMQKYFREYENMPDWSWHQFVGAIYAIKLFPYISKDCYKAILTHSTGDSNMSTMQKVIYAADKIEPTRGYDSSIMISACLKDYNDGFLLTLKTNLEFIKEKNGFSSNNLFTNRCITYYLSK